MKLVNIEGVPVHCNLLWPTKAEAQSANRGDIHLTYCSSCSHVYNASFDAQKMTYTQAYENSLHFSPRFQSYAQELAEELVERYDLRGKDLVEIGSGQGDFLKMLCELGGNRGTGFDPSYIENPDASYHSGVSFVRDFYSELYASHPADFIYSRHVLEHIQDPALFLQMIRKAVGDRAGMVIFFEVPNVLYTLVQLGIWDIIYEHCSYFSPLSLQTLFSQNGFKVLDTKERFGGQFLTIEGAPGQPAGQNLSEAGAELEFIRQYAIRIAKNHEEKIASWRNRLEKIAGKNQRVALWGAGSKGVTFLNVLDTQGTIEFVIDLNPRKQNMFVSGTGQQIVSPEQIRMIQPEIVIVMNPNYEAEIRQELVSFGSDASIVLA